MTTPFGLIPPVTLPDPGLQHAADHRERAIGTLIGQFRDKARFTKLVEIFIRPFQELEDVFWDLYTKRRIDTAAGEQLNVIGRILLEQRGGLSDDDFRAILRIKAKVLFSNGTGPNLIQIVHLFLGRDDFFTYDEFYPASVSITITDLTAVGRIATLARFLKRAKSAGVRLDVIDATGAGLGDAFKYGGTSANGYGSGHYASVI